MNSILRRRLPWLVLAALFAAALACNPPGVQSPDTAGTVNAISTSVQQTLVAQITPAPTTNTPLPPTIVASPNPTTAPTFVAPSPTSTSLLTRPNGPIIHAGHSALAPTIEGDLNEWGVLPNTIDDIVFQAANWSGTADNSALFAVAWDTTYLYLAVQVTDDVHVQTQHGELLFRGDSLELQFDADLGGDYSSAQLSGDDFQLGLSPGDFTGNAPETYLWNPRAQAGQPIGVVLAAGPGEGGGYRLEAAIPWALFNATPVGGKAYGLALNSSDNDTPETADQQSMISSVPTRTLTNPTTWGTLVLDP